MTTISQDEEEFDLFNEDEFLDVDKLILLRKAEEAVKNLILWQSSLNKTMEDAKKLLNDRKPKNKSSILQSSQTRILKSAENSVTPINSNKQSQEPEIKFVNSKQTIPRSRENSQVVSFQMRKTQNSTELSSNNPQKMENVDCAALNPKPISQPTISNLSIFNLNNFPTTMPQELQGPEIIDEIIEKPNSNLGLASNSDRNTQDLQKRNEKSRKNKEPSKENAPNPENFKKTTKESQKNEEISLKSSKPSEIALENQSLETNPSKELSSSTKSKNIQKSDGIAIFAETDCPICLLDLFDGTPIYTLPCDHAVHLECASQITSSRAIQKKCVKCFCPIDVQVANDIKQKHTHYVREKRQLERYSKKFQQEKEESKKSADSTSTAKEIEKPIQDLIMKETLDDSSTKTRKNHEKEEDLEDKQQKKKQKTEKRKQKNKEKNEENEEISEKIKEKNEKNLEKRGKPKKLDSKKQKEQKKTENSEKNTKKGRGRPKNEEVNKKKRKREEEQIPSTSDSETEEKKKSKKKPPQNKEKKKRKIVHQKRQKSPNDFLNALIDDYSITDTEEQSKVSASDKESKEQENKAGNHEFDLNEPSFIPETQNEEKNEQNTPIDDENNEKTGSIENQQNCTQEKIVEEENIQPEEQEERGQNPQIQDNEAEMEQEPHFTNGKHQNLKEMEEKINVAQLTNDILNEFQVNNQQMDIEKEEGDPKYIFDQNLNYNHLSSSFSLEQQISDLNLVHFDGQNEKTASCKKMEIDIEPEIVSKEEMAMQIEQQPEIIENFVEEVLQEQENFDNEHQKIEHFEEEAKNLEEEAKNIEEEHHNQNNIQEDIQKEELIEKEHQKEENMVQEIENIDENLEQAQKIEEKPQEAEKMEEEIQKEGIQESIDEDLEKAQEFEGQPQKEENIEQEVQKEEKIQKQEKIPEDVQNVHNIIQKQENTENSLQKAENFKSADNLHQEFQKSEIFEQEIKQTTNDIEEIAEKHENLEQAHQKQVEISKKNLKLKDILSKSKIIANQQHHQLLFLNSLTSEDQSIEEIEPINPETQSNITQFSIITSGITQNSSSTISIPKNEENSKNTNFVLCDPLEALRNSCISQKMQIFANIVEDSEPEEEDLEEDGRRNRDKRSKRLRKLLSETENSENSENSDSLKERLRKKLQGNENSRSQDQEIEAENHQKTENFEEEFHENQIPFAELNKKFLEFKQNSEEENNKPSSSSSSPSSNVPASQLPNLDEENQKPKNFEQDLDLDLEEEEEDSAKIKEIKQKIDQDLSRMILNSTTTQNLDRIENNNNNEVISSDTDGYGSDAMLSESFIRRALN